MSEYLHTYRSSGRKLSAREGEILRLVVRSFVDTAGPVGSRFLAKRFSVGLSAASIRNTMSDLEDRGLLDHPYTSAGRVPTELGFRTFVDQLMRPGKLSATDQAYLYSHLEAFKDKPELLLKECSRILGQLSHLLGVVLGPRLSSGILERLDLMRLSSERIMFVISLQGGVVRTVILELQSNLDTHDLNEVVQLLNERLSGLAIEEIRNTYSRRMQDVKDEPTGIVKLVLHSSDHLFSDADEGRVQFAGAENIVSQPEFMEAPQEVKTLVQMLENENFIVELLEDDDSARPGLVQVRIGSELNDGKASQLAVVTAKYKFRNTESTLGVIGPKRMNYAHVFTLVQTVSDLMNSDLEHGC